MKFIVALTSYMEALGYNTEHWRKSLDEKYTMCHLDFAVLAEKEYIDVYDVQSEEFRNLLSSPEWSKEEYVEAMEEVE